MTNNQNEVALSEVIGFILLMGLIVAVFSVWVIYVVPSVGREAEIIHIDEIKNGFTDYKISLDSVWLNNKTGVTTSTTFNLGTQGGSTQAGGLFLPLLQPFPSTGIISIADEGDTLSIDCSSNLTDVTNSQFPLNISKVKYDTGNYYWIQQQYYYQTGGVFLSQDQRPTIQGGVTNRISPPISVFGTVNRVWVNIIPIQIDGGGHIGGTGPARVDSRLKVQPPLNISYPGHQANSWVNISINVGDNQTARVWRDLFNGIAVREQIPPAWYTVNWMENPQTHRSTVFMLITGPNTDNTQDVYLTVNRVAFYVALNNVESGVPPTPPDPVTAAFTGSPLSGLKPLPVQFTDASTGPVTTWSWTFGDGNVSSLQSPLYTYLNGGTYSVSLTVSNGTGSNALTKTNYISVNVPPAPVTAAFSGSPLSGIKPLPVQFTDASTGPVTSRLWAFGDGNTSTLQNPLYTYPNVGIYSVNLTVSNGTGSNTLTKLSYITVNAPPAPVTAAFSGSPLSGIKPLAVQFTDASTGPVTSRLWTFGDGNVSSVQSPLYTYPNAGTYSVSLTVSNGTGSNTLTKPSYITVNAPPAPVTAAFSGSPLSGIKPLAVQFTDASTGPVTSRLWTFGDGNVSSVQSPLYTYPNAGTYSVSLMVSNGTGNNTLTKPSYITANAPYIQRVVAGRSTPYTDTTGKVWSADQAFLTGSWGYTAGGQYGPVSSSISGTPDPALYQTERYGNFQYQFTVPNGNYNVMLKFAEIYWDGSNQRIFNVNIEGTQVMSNVDLYALVGKNAAYDRTFPVTVSDGLLNINFQTLTDNAKISSIEVVRV
ncbi:MAG: PKD domain-containing protein [Methanoregula sp.]|nr:PKD domain-containing protein [Methanoregula sp.]